MGKFTLITSREYLNKITNKTFILSTLLTPLFIAGIVFFIGWLTSVNNERIKTISVVDNTGYIYDKIKSSSSIKYELLGDFSLEEAKIISDAKSDYGLLYINNLELPKSIADSISFISEEASLTIINNIESQLEKILTNENFKIEGIDIEKINSKKIYVNLLQETFQGEKTTKSDGLVKYIFGLALGLLLYMFIFVYGSMIMMSVIEEKTNRIIEIVVSSVKPFYLMTGKIIGTSLAGLTQFIVWGVLFFIFTSIISSIFGISSTYEDSQIVLNASQDSAVSSAALGMISAFINLPLTNIMIAFVLYFLGGYLLYASIFAAIGAAVDNQTDAQQFLMPITIILIVALYVGMLTVPEDPNGIVAQIFSFVPLTSPIVMMMRIPHGVPLIEQIISVLILFLSVILIIWIAAKIYRIGILMYGKKPSYKELMKWLKY
ncbi:MAG: ABC transporter permease [Flavobacteriaceae bacterium]